MTDHRVPLGRTGEAIAEDFLRRRGHRVLDRRFRTRRGEVDLVTRSGEHVYFVEVKTRRPGSAAFGGAWESVPAARQRRMAGTAQRWLARHDPTLVPHLAVLMITVHGDRAELEFLPDAFGL